MPSAQVGETGDSMAHSRSLSKFSGLFGMDASMRVRIIGGVVHVVSCGGWWFGRGRCSRFCFFRCSPVAHLRRPRCDRNPGTDSRLTEMPCIPDQLSLW
jgi:hypothetical protein